MYQVICSICHEQFKAARKDKKFCSDSCKTFSSNTMKNLTPEFVADAMCLSDEDSYRQFFHKHMFTKNGKLDIQKCKSELLMKHIKVDLLLFANAHNTLQDLACKITAWLHNRNAKSCPVCSRETNFYINDKDYRTYCSEECYQVSMCKGGVGRKVIENSNISKYGSSSTLQLPGVREKTLITLQERYGVDNPMKNSAILKRALSNNGSVRHKKSSYEKEISQFLTSMGVVNTVSDYNVLSGKQLDIYCPGHKLAIEFNGLYWHSEVFKEKRYHLEKTEMCESQGIQLIHIWEDEWVEKQDVVRSLLKAKLGIKTPVSYARQHKVVWGNMSGVREFLDAHHIQGSVSSTHHLSLIDKAGVIQAVMLFTKRKDGLELVRFASNECHGAFGKLLSHFRREFVGIPIYSFGDRCVVSRLSNIYLSHGFTEEEVQKPDYKYHKPGTFMREHKFGFRKDSFARMGYDVEGKTESQLATEAGLVRIWNCGLIKYRLDR
ncbi:hypothetical protein HQ81_0113 [Dickeya phage phiDP23.1]|uniref:Homing endonuclease F-LimVII n=16 Tax=Aglimvirinae TaxID=2169530 RepID=I0J311_9CAUD|nr:homing endonuclease [Dickeya phage vB-DsoM-LIMEstone1]AIM51295.1 hypothetical protein HQ80_0134 [Dickeya phage phiD3]AIM51468.1 hypothetical protein HQ82_0211 [Dickeya phage phiDP10.3]AIM51982.1 hypothetical protein HQ81_0113 [Dickeya phage phiDP23.1]ASD51321.1 putative homing endonuclease F-LimVII [Dickeya phage JA15]ASD51518.1 putative homing endonuclease F-LimVII [Dickeya phage XF4]ATW62139.1 putative homing endonuclease [Dickeya phage PP35]AYN55516.1 putative homing endonuclease [Dick